MFLAEQQFLRDVQNIDCVIWLITALCPKGVLLTRLHRLFLLTDNREIALKRPFRTALVVDAARQYMTLLEGKWSMRAGSGHSSDE